MVISKDAKFAMALMHRDPELKEMDLSNWTITNERSGDMVHTVHNATVLITGVHGRFVIRWRTGRYHKGGAGKRPSYFKRPSTAIKYVEKHGEWN
jgi:hypothetical protein